MNFCNLDRQVLGDIVADTEGLGHEATWWGSLPLLGNGLFLFGLSFPLSLVCNNAQLILAPHSPPRLQLNF